MKRKADREGEVLLATSHEQRNTTLDETLPLLHSSARPLDTSDGVDIDKALEQLLSSSGGGEGETTPTEEDEEETKFDVHQFHVPPRGALSQIPLLSDTPIQRHGTLPPISTRGTSSTIRPTDLSSLPPLTSSPLSGSIHVPTSLTPLDKIELKPPASMQQPSESPAGSKKEGEETLSHLLRSEAVDKDSAVEVSKKQLRQPQYETHPISQSPPTDPLPPPDTSLNDEALSELSEELSDLSSYDDDQPLMHSEGLKTLENLKLVSTDDDDEEEEDFNKMSETDYEQRKKEMEEVFESRRIKPGDDSFVYDKEVEFAEAKMESGWDDDEEPSDLEF